MRHCYWYGFKWIDGYFLLLRCRAIMVLSNVFLGGCTMKKYVSLILLLFLLFGCQEKLPEERYVEIHPKYQGYATHIKIEEDKAYIDSLSQKAFQVYIFKIEYVPIKEMIYIEYEIYDGSYQNATYMTVGREGNSMNEDDTRLHKMTSSRRRLSEYFYGIDLSLPFHILFGKYDGDDLNSTSLIRAVKSITFTSDSKKERHKVETLDYDFAQETDFTLANPAYIAFDYSLSDPNQMINQVHFVLVEKSTGVELDEIAFTDLDDVRDEDVLSFEDIRFEGVGPGVEYHILVVLTGHDGIDAFEKVVYQVFAQTVGHYLNNTHETSYHGLYAAITDVVREGEEVIIRYMIHNDHTMQNEYGHEPKITLRIVSHNYEELNPPTLYEDLDVTEETGEIRLPRESFKYGVSIVISLPEYHEALASYYMSSHKLAVNVSKYSQYVYSIYVHQLNDFSDAISVELMNNNDEIIDQFSFIPIEGHNTFSTDLNLWNTFGLKVRVTYTVDTLVGPFTHTRTYPLA